MRWNLKRRTLVNGLAYQLGWLVAVWSAAGQRPWQGAAACAVLVAVQWVGHPHWRREMGIVAAVAALGWAVDSAQALAGVFRFHGAGAAAWMCPPWLVGIWALFGTTLNGALSWLRGRPGLAAAFGAVGGPLAYGAGAKLGAVTPHPDGIWYLAELALLWGALVPILFLVVGALETRLPSGTSLPERRHES